MGVLDNIRISWSIASDIYKIRRNYMQEIIFDRNNYESYKDFYVQIYKDLDGKSFGDWRAYDNLNYNADMIDEFLWYNNDKKLSLYFKTLI